MLQVEEGHRVAVTEAEAREAEARKAELDGSTRQEGAMKARDDLTAKREQAETYRQEINAAYEQAETYAGLAEILKEGGPLQTEVAEQEQRRIAQEVNEVLGLLGDALRVAVGQARRRQRVQLQDIHIRDTSDPSGQARFFEYLSGGEQFRIALALALALHRRVGQRTAGTIIFDEGFGWLDADRRDALALQMTNTGEGILKLRLAESIIICSHSSEVQRHFPHRWLVHKQGGTATVTRPDLDGEA